jgi:IclR family transcriptional regulator, pca regulon regulatory protein
MIITDEPALRPPAEPSVRTLARGLSVLSVFDHANPSMRAADVAARAGLNRAATARLLRTLVQLGYLRCHGEKFALTHQTLELGHGYLSGSPLVLASRQGVEWLTGEFKEPCTAGVLADGHVICIAATRVPGMIRAGLTVGARIPAHASSMGKVLMAGLGEDEFRATLDGSQFSRLTEQTIDGTERLRLEIEQVRRQGYAVNDSELQTGHRTVSVPVRGAAGAVLAAVGVNMLATPDTLQAATAAHLPPLRRAAERIAEGCTRV